MHPYPKPLSVRDDNHVQHDHEVASMGGIAGVQPLPVGLVVATTYTPGAPWEPRRLSRGEGVLALLSHTVAAQTRPEQAMRFLRRAVEAAAIIAEPPRRGGRALGAAAARELDADVDVVERLGELLRAAGFGDQRAQRPAGRGRRASSRRFAALFALGREDDARLAILLKLFTDGNG